MKSTWVTRELHKGKWVNTYFDEPQPAKTLMRKIMKAGGVAIALRSAQ